MRRLFRFRLRTLLLTPVLVAIGWWWISWPERKARRFVELLAAGDVDAARAMSDESGSMDQFWQLAKSKGLTFAPPSLQVATWQERVSAVRQFKIPWSLNSSRGELQGFVAARGRVRLRAADGTGLFLLFQLKNTPADSVADKLSTLFNSKSNSNVIFRADARMNRVLMRIPDPLESHAKAWAMVLDSLAESPQQSPTYISKEAMERVRQELQKSMKNEQPED